MVPGSLPSQLFVYWGRHPNLHLILVALNAYSHVFHVHEDFFLVPQHTWDVSSLKCMELQVQICTLCIQAKFVLEIR